jgi:hypothetical protein
MTMDRGNFPRLRYLNLPVRPYLVGIAEYDRLYSVEAFIASSIQGELLGLAHRLPASDVTSLSANRRWLPNFMEVIHAKQAEWRPY